MREATQDLGRTLERLPAMLANAEQAAADVASGGLRLHPSSLEALDAGRSETGTRWAVWIALAALLIALAVALWGGA